MGTALTWAGYIAAGLLVWLAVGLAVAVLLCRGITLGYDEETTPQHQATKGYTP